MKSYSKIQEDEAKTWLIEDFFIRRDKVMREIARYPMMIKQIGLNYIDTSWMTVADIGCGPLGGVSSIIPCKVRHCIDPLVEEYSKYFDISAYTEPFKGEDLKDSLSQYDLIIVTNALDHFEFPFVFLRDLVTFMKPGSWFAHFHAIDNALTHPHDAHQWNINPLNVHEILDTDFETVWELKYPEVRYGWVNYQGKVGQPAFCGLFRKVTGYGT